MSTTVFALTSTFTPPATCLSTVYQYGPPTSRWWELGPSDAPDCLPPNYQSSSDFHYSPGVCPSGYTEACNSSVIVGGSVTVTETRATCCPSNYACQTQTFYAWYTTLGCTFISAASTTYPYISGSVTTAVAVGGGINARSVQIRWQSTDFRTTPAATETKTVTISATPTNPASNQGLTTGSKVGIGIGVPLAIIVIGLLVWIGLILKKRHRVSRTEPEAQAETIPRFQDKVERPDLAPTNATVTSRSTVRELP